jgi:hypothetical protein
MIRTGMKPTRTTAAAALGIITMVLATACSDPTLPPAPVVAPATITDTFTGTLSPSSTNQHTFAVTQVGSVRVTLTDVEPSSAIGIGIGTPSVAGCLTAASNTAVAGSTILMSGTATVTGNFCVSVSDVGNLVEPVQYTILVTHS